MRTSEDLDRKYLPDFKRRFINSGDGDILTLVGGNGPPLLLLHGDPQTHLCWQEVAPKLAEHFTVVLTDLRGRGESHKPGAGGSENAYRKRTHAAEQLAVMRDLGFEQFYLAGHDRGARVARRVALDYPEAVMKLAVLDIVPMLDFYDRTNAAIAQDYYYFFFLTQPAPIPENLIAGDPRTFMAQILGLATDSPYADDVYENYLTSATAPAAIEAMCECFRAGPGVDYDDDRQDRLDGTKIKAPTLVMWGEHGVVGQYFDLEEIWRGWCEQTPSFNPLPCGHFLPEEQPEKVTQALLDFFG